MPFPGENYTVSEMQIGPAYGPLLEFSAMDDEKAEVSSPTENLDPLPSFQNCQFSKQTNKLTGRRKDRPAILW